MAASSVPNYFSDRRSADGNTAATSPHAPAPSREAPATFSSHQNGTVVVRLSGAEQQLAESMTMALGIVQHSPKVILDLTAFGLLSSEAIGKLIHSAPANEGAIVVTSATRSKLESMALVNGDTRTVSVPFRWEVLGAVPSDSVGAHDFARSAALQEAFAREQERASSQGEMLLSSAYFRQHSAAPAALEHRESAGRSSIKVTKPAAASDQYDTLLEAIRGLPLDNACSVDISAIDCHGRQLAALVLMACRDRLRDGGSPLEIVAGPNAKALLRPEMGAKLGYTVA